MIYETIRLLTPKTLSSAAHLPLLPLHWMLQAPWRHMEHKGRGRQRREIEGEEWDDPCDGELVLCHALLIGRGKAGNVMLQINEEVILLALSFSDESPHSCSSANKGSKVISLARDYD